MCAQGPNANMPTTKGGAIAGTVIDEKSQSPIEYANITIFKTDDSSLVTGGITDEQGRFMITELQPGSYYASVKFIGYESTTVSDLNITSDKRFAKAGLITLNASAQNLNELNVVADKQQVMYKIDKKVVNPSQFLAAQGGSATDILANTPSMEVDIEGNVTMRGSSNFTVLINGKPTPFDATDALDQVPASTIENIEIITNPSAKFDPDGAAGIINIITKKETQKGWNGIVNLNANTLGSYGGDALFNFTGDKMRWYVGANRNNRIRKANYASASGTIDTDSGDTTHLANDGTRNMGFYSNSLKTGVDVDISKNSTLGVELSLGNKGRIADSELTTEEWITGNSIEYSTSETNTESLEDFIDVSLNQQTLFNGDRNHSLISSIQYQVSKGDDNTTSDNYDLNGDVLTGQKTWEEGNDRKLVIRTDYTQPWVHGKFELGYQFKLDEEWSNYDAQFEGIETDQDFYNESDFSRLINSAYTTFSGEKGQFGYQAGLRAEHTLRQIEQFNGENNNEIKRLDWYPSLHLSYNLKAEQSVMTSYTRRIDRPRSHWLDPYVAWQDPNNVRQGNPSLAPQYINSFEMSYQKRFESNFVSVELFHRQVEDKIERVQGKYDDGIILSSYENVGKDYSTGIEMMVSYNITPWWSANLSGSIYDYRLSVNEEFNSDINETQSSNWKGRLSNTFKPTQNFRIQLDAMYNSPTVTATGSKDGMLFSSLALKHSFLENKLDVGISMKDVFNTARMEMTSNGESFYSNYSFDMKWPSIQFSLSYKFKNYKAERKGSGAADSGMDMEY